MSSPITSTEGLPPLGEAPAPLAAEAPTVGADFNPHEIVGMKHRQTGAYNGFFDIEAIRDNPDLYPVNAKGQEVHNAPASTAAPQPDQPLPSISGVASAEEAATLRRMVSELSHRVAVLEGQVAMYLRDNGG